MAEYMVDESWGRADPAGLPPDVTTVAGYLSFDATKNLTRANIDGYHAAGRSILLNWEASSGGALNAQNAGPHATTACQEAKALGAPARTAIVYSDDTDSSLDQVRPYYRMVAQVTRSAGYRPGAYGGADIVQGLLAEGLVDVAWVANASSWSHGVAITSAHIKQLLDHPFVIGGFGSNQFDANEILRPIPGLWTATGATTGEPDMGYSDWAPLERIAFMQNVRDTVVETLMGLKFLSQDPRVQTEGAADTQTYGLWAQHGDLAKPGSLHTIDAHVLAVLAAVTKLQSPGAPVDVSALQAAIEEVPHDLLVALQKALPAS